MSKRKQKRKTKKVQEIAVDLNRPVEEIAAIVEHKIPPENILTSGETVRIDETGQDLVALAVAIPLAVPVRHEATVIRVAPNPSYVYAKIQGKDGLVPVVIPRRLAGKLEGKRIIIDAIQDASGQITYRHEQLGRPHA